MTARTKGSAGSSPSEPIVLAGRTFRLVGRTVTFANDLYIGRELNATGFSVAFHNLASTPELDRVRAQVLLNAHSSARLITLLAGLLHEDGVPWTEESAAKAAAFLGGLTDPVEKEQLLNTAVTWILGFFLNGLGSPATSQSSSERVAAETPTIPKKNRRRRTAAPSTSGRGTASS